jgi:flagellar hook-associated protein 3 FlgL
MTISTVGNNISPLIQSVLNLNTQLDDLQRQLATGQKSSTFAGLGPQSGVAIGLDSQLSAISGFDDTITNANVRVSIATQVLTQITKDGNTVKSGTLQANFDLGNSGQTTGQRTARDQLDQILGLLNTQAGSRYIFSGTGVNQASVDTADHVLNGNGAAAGLKQVVSERNQADLGTTGLGRLVIPPAGPAAAKILGTGATLSPDAPAAGVGTVPSLASGTLLTALGVTVGDTISVSDGTSTSSHVVTNADTVGSLITALNSGPAAAVVSLPTTGLNAGHLQVQATNATSTITVSDTNATPGADIATLGFTAGNTTFTPTNLLTQGAVTAGQTLTVAIGANPIQTVTFGTGVGQVATLAQLQTTLSTLLGATATAVVDPTSGNVTLTAANTTDTIAVGGTATAAKFGIQSATAGPTTAVRVSEDVAGSPFGFKLASVTSTLTGAIAVAPSGSPPVMSVNLASNPNAGETATFNFKLPDGSSENLTLTATTSTTPGANQFTIGATPAATAANLQAALTASVGTLAHTALSAASAIQASSDFFNISVTTAPSRVAGPPFGTATSLVAGTPSNTVFWYTGENGSAPARSTSVARIDPSISISYGLRANEQGIRWIVQNIAVLAATTYSATDPNAKASYLALNQRAATQLGIPTGVQKIDDIQADLANANATATAASDRHRQTQNTLTNLLQTIEGISQDQVGAQILAMQTTLQASLQTTAKIAQMSLINYLPA